MVIFFNFCFIFQIVGYYLSFFRYLSIVLTPAMPFTKIGQTFNSIDREFNTLAKNNSEIFKKIEHFETNRDLYNVAVKSHIEFNDRVFNTTDWMGKAEADFFNQISSFEIDFLPVGLPHWNRKAFIITNNGGSSQREINTVLIYLEKLTKLRWSLSDIVNDQHVLLRVGICAAKHLIEIIRNPGDNTVAMQKAVLMYRKEIWVVNEALHNFNSKLDEFILQTRNARVNFLISMIYYYF